MDYLFFLQQLRDAAPVWLNETILFVSEFVAGIGGLALMALVYWCISKRAGSFLMMNFSLAYVCNTVVKNIFCIERPFNRDARLTPYVPASGYSFPSGHTMMATGVYGGLAVWQRRRKWFAAICVLMVFVTAISRNWLGAHTIEDVLFGIFCSGCVVALNAVLLDLAEKKSAGDLYIFAGSVLVFIAFCFLYPTSLKPAGIFGGVMLGWIIERRFIRFEISKSVPFRAVTFVAGMVVVGLINKVLMPALVGSFEKSTADLLTNFVTFLAVGAGWPAVIKLLMRKKNGEARPD